MRAPRYLSLRVLLALVSLVLAMPMLVFAVTVGAMQVRLGRREVEAEAIRDARDLLERAGGLLILALPASRLQAALAPPRPAAPFDKKRFPSLVDREGQVVARWHRLRIDWHL